MITKKTYPLPILRAVSDQKTLKIKIFELSAQTGSDAKV